MTELPPLLVEARAVIAKAIVTCAWKSFPRRNITPWRACTVVMVDPHIRELFDFISRMKSGC